MVKLDDSVFTVAPPPPVIFLNLHNQFKRWIFVSLFCTLTDSDKSCAFFPLSCCIASFRNQILNSDFADTSQLTDITYNLNFSYG